MFEILEDTLTACEALQAAMGASSEPSRWGLTPHDSFRAKVNQKRQLEINRVCTQ